MIDIGTRTHASTDAKPAGPLLFPAFAAFLILAPLYKEGITPLPLLVLELAAVGFLFEVLAVRRDVPALPRALVAGLAILLVYPLLQMIPLPETLWRNLPGHAGYAAAIDRFAAGVIGGGSVSPAHTLSLIPEFTEQGWLAILPPVACLLVVLQLRPEEVTRLLLIMVVFAAIEGLLGLLQASPLGGSIVYFPVEVETVQGRAFGTFVNPNHFAALLAMMVPVVIGLFAYGIRHERHVRVAGYPARRPHTGAGDSHALAQRALLFASAVMILLCLVMTWSRAGIATGLVGLALSALLIPRRHGGVMPTRYVVAGLFGTAAILALLVGVTPIVEKLAPEQLGEGLEGRWLMTMTTLRAAVEFLPFGSGLSTLDMVFPRFQPATVKWGVNFAHNDYAQAFMEMGLAAPAMIGLALWAYGARMAELLRHRGGRSFTILQLAAGVALAPTLLHSAFEFGLHMPPIAMWFATLAGVMFHRGISDHDPAPA